MLQPIMAASRFVPAYMAPDPVLPIASTGVPGLDELLHGGVPTERLHLIEGQGVIGMAMAAPVDMSYLADAIILLRFFEASGEMRKAISVVKKRTGQHETTIRELQFGDGRVRVGEPLRDFHGVLTGVPQYTGAAKPLLSDARPPAAR